MSWKSLVLLMVLLDFAAARKPRILPTKTIENPDGTFQQIEVDEDESVEPIKQTVDNGSGPTLLQDPLVQTNPQLLGGEEDLGHEDSEHPIERQNVDTAVAVERATEEALQKNVVKAEELARDEKSGSATEQLGEQKSGVGMDILIKGMGDKLLDIMSEQANRGGQTPPKTIQIPDVPDCNTDLLKMFGLIDDGVAEKTKKPLKNLVKANAYCRKNKYSCCTHKDIQRVLPDFVKGKRELLSKLESVEELLSVFRGPNFVDFVKSFPEDHPCRTGFSDATYFQYELLKPKLTEIETLLNNFEDYIKRQVWWISNSYCTVCSPFNHPYFNLQAQTVQTQDSSCRDMLEDLDVEVRLTRFYRDIVVPTVKLIQCEKKEEQKAPEVTFPNYETVKTSVEVCLQVNNMMDADCQKLCNKKFGVYEYPGTFFKSVKQSLEILYNRLTGGEDIVEFYSEVKDQPYYTNTEDNIIFFYDQTKIKTHREALTRTWDHTKGVTVLNDFMHKRFYGASVAKLLAIIFSVVAVLF